jgi:HD-like signal output (HDOD) protein
MSNLEDLLVNADELPALPEIYFRVSEQIDDEDVTAHEIGDTVQTDPYLTGRILKLINSAYYGLQYHVTSVAQAVSLLGRRQLRQILIGSVLSEAFEDVHVSDFPIHSFWAHSIKTAIIARHLGMQNAQVLDHEAYFTAGLLHDLGWLVIAKAEPGSYLQVDNIVQNEGRDALEVENELLGVNHVDVGAALMAKWAMPSVISICVKKHHETDHSGPMGLDTGIVYLANKLSRFELNQGEEEMESVVSSIKNWEQTKCTLDQIVIACELADNQWVEVMDSLGMLPDSRADDVEEKFEFATGIDRFSGK